MGEKRVLSGMRPTGRLHLGNLHGALNNWLELQNDGEHECFYCVADWHALTSDYADTECVRKYSQEMIIDWLSVGLDPLKSTIFIQSAIKEHAELFLILSMITPLSWLERNPTYKEMKDELVSRDISTYGFLGYPVLQASDIIIYKAEVVPVGVDQLPHIELTREIARRFNFLYGEEVFPLPASRLTATPKLLGIDGRKMSKSYDNSIYIADRGDELRVKVYNMITDTKRARRKDPGSPEVCNVFAFHGIYSSASLVARLKSECEGAQIGCRDCKGYLFENILAVMEPIHEKMDYYSTHQGDVEAIIHEGNAKARKIASETMSQVRSVVKI